MKSLNTLIKQTFTRRQNPVYQQMEFSLGGSRLDRDEVRFLSDLRRLRDNLAKA